MHIFKSVYSDQGEVLSAINTLHLAGEGVDCDITYGNGAFYKKIPEPKLKYDITPQKEGVIEADSQNLPLEKGSVKSIMFDPPFLTYVKQGREHNSIMAKRFSGFWRYDELEDYYKNTINECSRILNKKNTLIIKCQDIIHNHKMHCTHQNVINWAKSFRLKDLFVLVANHRMPCHNPKKLQKHARIFHSYFLVFERS